MFVYGNFEKVCPCRNRKSQRKSVYRKQHILLGNEQKNRHENRNIKR